MSRRGWTRAAFERAAHLLQRRRRRRELEEEMRLHLEHLQRDFERRGMTRRAARARARQQFGPIETIKEQVDDASGVRPAFDFLADLRFAARRLRRRPAHLVMCVAMLTIGITAATTLATVVESVLLRPLRFPEPDRLVALWGTVDGEDTRFGNASLPDLEDWAAATELWDALGGFTGGRMELGIGDGAPDLVDVGRVTSAFFDVLRLEPVIGRMPRAADFGTESDAVVVSYDTWRQRFGSDPELVGRTVRLGDAAYRIAGVAGPSPVTLPRSAEFWVAFTDDVHRGSRSLQAIGRLAPDASLAVASEAMAARSRVLSDRYPETNAGRSVRLRSLHDHVVGSSRSLLAVFLAAACLVFLVTCFNTANLLFAASAQRRPELAIRRALGAGRARLVRLVLAEAALLAVLAAALSLFASHFAIAALRVSMPELSARWSEVGIGLGALGATGALAIAATLLIGTSPAWSIVYAPTATLDLRPAREQQGRVLSDTTLSVQVAVTFVLVFAAALLLRNVWQLQRVDPGVDPDGVVTFRITLPASRYRSLAEVFDFHDRLSAAVRAAPGTLRVGAVNVLPFSEDSLGDTFAVDGGERDAAASSAQLRTVQGDYFTTLGVEFLAGRSFAPADDLSGARVAVVNRAFVEVAWGRVDPLGRVVNFFGEDRQIVGLVGDVRGFGVDRPPAPTVYVPFAQQPSRFVTYAVKSTDAPGTMEQLRPLVARLDNQLPLESLQLLRAGMRDAIQAYRARAGLLTVLGGVALALAALGVYGLAACRVEGERFDNGVRMALGATGAAVRRRSLSSSMLRVAVGVVLGAVAALPAGALLRSLIVGVTATDATALLLTAATLGAAAVAGAWWPSRQASRVDPVEALRRG